MEGLFWITAYISVTLCVKMQYFSFEPLPNFVLEIVMKHLLLGYLQQNELGDKTSLDLLAAALRRSQSTGDLDDKSDNNDHRDFPFIDSGLPTIHIYT